MYIRGVSNLNQFLTFYVNLAPFANRVNTTDFIFNEGIGFALFQAQYEPSTNKIRADKLLFNETLEGAWSLDRLKTDRIFLAIESKLTS